MLPKLGPLESVGPNSGYNPIFNLEKQEGWQPPGFKSGKIRQIAAGGGVIIIVLADGRLIRWCPSEGKESQFIQFGNNDRPAGGAIHSVFVDPSGAHIIISVVTADTGVVYYCNHPIGVDSQPGVKELTLLRNHVINTLAWCPEAAFSYGLVNAKNRRDNVRTGPFLIGTTAGRILCLRIEAKRELDIGEVFQPKDLKPIGDYSASIQHTSGPSGAFSLSGQARGATINNARAMPIVDLQWEVVCPPTKPSSVTPSRTGSKGQDIQLARNIVVFVASHDYSSQPDAFIEYSNNAVTQASAASAQRGLASVSKLGASLTSTSAPAPVAGKPASLYLYEIVGSPGQGIRDTFTVSLSKPFTPLPHPMSIAGMNANVNAALMKQRKEGPANSSGVRVLELPPGAFPLHPLPSQPRSSGALASSAAHPRRTTHLRFLFESPFGKEVPFLDSYTMQCPSGVALSSGQGLFSAELLPPPTYSNASLINPVMYPFPSALYETAAPARPYSGKGLEAAAATSAATPTTKYIPHAAMSTHFHNIFMTPTTLAASLQLGNVPVWKHTLADERTGTFQGFVPASPATFPIGDPLLPSEQNLYLSLHFSNNKRIERIDTQNIAPPRKELCGLVYSEGAIYRLEVIDERRGLWHVYTQLGQFDIARQLAGDDETKLAVILDAEAEVFLQSGLTDSAVLALVASSMSLELVCSRLQKGGHTGALIEYLLYNLRVWKERETAEYLQKKEKDKQFLQDLQVSNKQSSDSLSNSDLTVRTQFPRTSVLAIWVLEVMLDKLHQETAPDKVDQDTVHFHPTTRGYYDISGPQPMRVRILDFLRTYKDDLDVNSTLTLLSASHGYLFVYYCQIMGFWHRLAAYFANRGQWHDVLDTIRTAPPSRTIIPRRDASALSTETASVFSSEKTLNAEEHRRARIWALVDETTAAGADADGYDSASSAGSADEEEDWNSEQDDDSEDVAQYDSEDSADLSDVGGKVSRNQRGGRNRRKYKNKEKKSDGSPNPGCPTSQQELWYKYSSFLLPLFPKRVIQGWKQCKGPLDMARLVPILIAAQGVLDAPEFTTQNALESFVAKSNAYAPRSLGTINDTVADLDEDYGAFDITTHFLQWYITHKRVTYSPSSKPIFTLLFSNLVKLPGSDAENLVLRFIIQHVIRPFNELLDKIASRFDSPGDFAPSYGNSDPLSDTHDPSLPSGTGVSLDDSEDIFLDPVARDQFFNSPLAFLSDYLPVNLHTALALCLSANKLVPAIVIYILMGLNRDAVLCALQGLEQMVGSDSKLSLYKDSANTSGADAGNNARSDSSAPAGAARKSRGDAKNKGSQKGSGDTAAGTNKGADFHPPDALSMVSKNPNPKTLLFLTYAKLAANLVGADTKTVASTLLTIDSRGITDANAAQFAFSEYAHLFQRGSAPETVFTNIRKNLWILVIRKCLELVQVHGPNILGYRFADSVGENEESPSLTIDDGMRILPTLEQAEVTLKDAAAAVAVALIQECGNVVSLVDILGYFPENVTLGSFCSQVAYTLRTADNDITALRDSMNLATKTSSRLREDLKFISSSAAVVNLNENCFLCNEKLGTIQYYVFLCQHVFHAGCLNEALIQQMTPSERTALQANHQLLAKFRDLISYLSKSTGGMSASAEQSVAKILGIPYVEVQKHATSTLIDMLKTRQKEVQMKIDEKIAAECLLCGPNMVESVDAPLPPLSWDV